MTNTRKAVVYISDAHEEQLLVQALKKEFSQVKLIKEFQDFWFDLINEEWNVVIVDVKNMGQHQLILKNHPKVRDESIPLIFYYNDKSIPLLTSTSNMFHWGTIKAGSEMLLELNAILQRIKKIEQVNLSQKEMHFELSRMQERALKLHETHQKLLIKNESQKWLKKLFKELSETSNSLNFIDSVSEILSNWSKVKKFSLIEVDSSLMKLISPPIVKDKYKALPSLWLGNASKLGIEFFAQNMSIQVASDILGIDLHSVRVFGANSNPDIIIYLTLEGDADDILDWELFENLLSNFYRKYLLKKQIVTEEKNEREILNPWELFEYIDKQSKISLTPNLVLIDLNLNPIIEILKENASSKLHWNSFIDDFFYSLSHLTKLNFKIGYMSIYRVALIADKKESDLIFDYVKKFVRDFSYWRYFENADSLFSKLITIPVKMVPFSTLAYIREFESGFELNAPKKKIEKFDDDFEKFFNKNIFGNA